MKFYWSNYDENRFIKCKQVDPVTLLFLALKVIWNRKNNEIVSFASTSCKCPIQARFQEYNIATLHLPVFFLKYLNFEGMGKIIVAINVCLHTMHLSIRNLNYPPLRGQPKVNW